MKNNNRINIAIRILLFSLLSTINYSQVIIDDFLVNSHVENISGLGRTSIAVTTNGNFAVAWHYYNAYDIPVAEQPRIAAQLFSSDSNPIGPLNLFRGESRSTSIWTGDYLEDNFDIAFMPDGTLLLVVEHQGEESFASLSSQTSEIGLCAINSFGEIIDLVNHPGIIKWLNDAATDLQNNPRIAVTSSGEFMVTFDGVSKETNFRKVQIQIFNSDGSTNDISFTPHIDDPAPQVNHRSSDISTNGNFSVVVWQDGRFDDNWDISAQFYSTEGAIGNNIKINQNDTQGTINISPSVDINSSGDGVIVWIDSRNNNYGDIYYQRFNSSAQLIGENIMVSNGAGLIADRPEVSILDNGDFMVVWTDSILTGNGSDGYRAKGRQFNQEGIPLNDPFTIPNQNVISGFANIDTEGTYYYCSWIDDRLGGDYLNVYAKVIGNVVTAVNKEEGSMPQEYFLAQNYPNPFNPSTTIRYSIISKVKSEKANKETFIRLQIFDLSGRRVAKLVNQKQKPGSYEVNFNAGDLSSGIYYYRLQVGDLLTSLSDSKAHSGHSFIETKKLNLIK